MCMYIKAHRDARDPTSWALGDARVYIYSHSRNALMQFRRSDKRDMYMCTLVAATAAAAAAAKPHKWHACMRRIAAAARELVCSSVAVE